MSSGGKKEQAGDGECPRLRIFLASTSEDLSAYRSRVVEAIATLEQEAASMETFGAVPHTPLATCRRKVKKADALVVIVAHRYGWVPTTEEGGDGAKSVTRYEVETALDAGKPVFAFVMDPAYPWSGRKETDRLSDAETDDEAQAVFAAVRGLKDFKSFLDSKVTTQTFTTPNDLASKVTSSLFPWLLEQALGQPRATEPSVPSEGDFTSYLEDLLDQTETINITGIATQHTESAHSYPIERLYTPLSSFRPVDRTPSVQSSIEAAMLRSERVDLSHLLPTCDRLLIEGQPGAGKTTFLRFVACMLARDRLGEPCPEGASWRQHHLALNDESPGLPILIRVSDLVALLTAADAPPLRRDNRLWLLDLLERTSAANGNAAGQTVSAAQWEQPLASGEAMLLLDGLDEAADDTLRQRIFEIFRDACKRWKCPVVVTSRPIATAPLVEMGFHTATIEPFGDREIHTFVEHWVAALHAAGRDRRAAGDERYSDTLSGAIVGRSRVRRLAGNPVMLTCLCVVHWNEGQLPEGRSRVYRSVLRWLIAARSQRRRDHGASDLFAWRAFARLALAMMCAEGGKRSTIDLEQAAEAVESLWVRESPQLDAEGRRLEARRWLTFECLGSGVVEEVSARRLRFWHLTFQEYLAALQLAWRGDGEDPAADWWPVVSSHLDNAQWRETIELLPGCLLDEGGVGRVDRLLERVLAMRGESPDLATEARVAGFLSRLLRPVDVLEYKPSAEVSTAYDQTLARSMAIFERESAGTVPVKLRIDVAEALGRAGDPRLAGGTDEQRLLAVPGLGGLRLGKFPVTVEEYQRFVEARGYEESEHWAPVGWQLKEDKDWLAPDAWSEQLEHPSRPVTEVSWYEADAYCRWLGEQRGLKIRLPTEKEWERAATPVEGEYPWGAEEPDEERANFAPDSEPDVGSPTPVGIYPLGRGPFGHRDLAGNVWEWCSDEEKVEWTEEPVRVLRGGGWGNPAESLRAAFRLGNLAALRNRGIGFRVLAAPPSLD